MKIEIVSEGRKFCIPVPLFLTQTVFRFALRFIRDGKKENSPAVAEEGEKQAEPAEPEETGEKPALTDAERRAVRATMKKCIRVLRNCRRQYPGLVLLEAVDSEGDSVRIRL